jgi:hypothetical protein
MLNQSSRKKFILATDGVDTVVVGRELRLHHTSYVSFELQQQLAVVQNS